MPRFFWFTLTRDDMGSVLISDSQLCILPSPQSIKADINVSSIYRLFLAT